MYFNIYIIYILTDTISIRHVHFDMNDACCGHVKYINIETQGGKDCHHGGLKPGKSVNSFIGFYQDIYDDI